MANTFKPYKSKSIGTAPVTVRAATVPTTLIGMTLANLLASPIAVDVYITSGGTDYYLIKNAVIPSGGTFIAVGGNQKIVMENGDAIKVVSNTAASVDAILSCLEIT